MEVNQKRNQLKLTAILLNISFVPLFVLLIWLLLRGIQDMMMGWIVLFLLHVIGWGALYNWAKYKGQNRLISLLILLSLPGYVIGGAVLIKLPNKNAKAGGQIIPIKIDKTPVNSGVKPGYCAACGADLLPRASFCRICGKPVPRVCAACGKVLPGNSSFCPGCGLEVSSLKTLTNRENNLTGPASNNTISAAAVPQQPKRQTSKMRKPAAIVGSVLIVAVLVPLLWFFVLSPHIPKTGIDALRLPGIPAKSEVLPSPVSLSYIDKDNQPATAWSIPGRVAIIAKPGSSPEAIQQLVSSLKGVMDTKLPGSGLYFVKGLDNRETATIDILLKSPLVGYTFPVPATAPASLWTTDDYLTLVRSTEGKYLHFAKDGTFVWNDSTKDAVTHGQMVGLLAGADPKNTADISFFDNNIVYTSNAEAFDRIEDMAAKDRETGEITVINNSWGSIYKNEPSAKEDPKKTFLKTESNVYKEFLQFLDSFPNSIAVKSAGNAGREDIDLSGIMAESKTKYSDAWKRFVIVGALDSNLEPADYSNKAVSQSDILWVPELKEVQGTSYTAPQISYLLDKLAHSRPDFKPEQLVNILFDPRVSPRINLRPTIVAPRADTTLNTALQVATDLYGARKTDNNPPTGNPDNSQNIPVGKVGIFPSSVTFQIDDSFSAVHMTANIDGHSIGEDNADTKTNSRYDIQWSVQGQMITHDVFLNKNVFLAAIGKAGTYTVNVTVTDRLNGRVVGTGSGTVVVKGKDVPVNKEPFVGEWVNDSPSYGFVVSETNGFLTWSYDVVLKLVETDPNTGGMHVEQPHTFTGTRQITLRGFDVMDGVHLNSDYAQVQASGRSRIGETSTSLVSGTVSGNVVTLYWDKVILHLSLDGDYLNGVTPIYNDYGRLTDVKPSTKDYITSMYKLSLRRK